MTTSEHETIITFDYENRTVSIYTTREGCKNGIIRRLGEEALKTCEWGNPSGKAWEITIPFALCRNPELICKLVNPEEKTPMPDGIFGGAA